MTDRDHTGIRSTRLRRIPVAAACLVVGAVMVVAGTGCQRALFPPDLPRNQFETYERMRQRYVPTEEPDVFGTPQPALRARLGQQR